MGLTDMFFFFPKAARMFSLKKKCVQIFNVLLVDLLEVTHLEKKIKKQISQDGEDTYSA